MEKINIKEGVSDRKLNKNAVEIFFESVAPLLTTKGRRLRWNPEAQGINQHTDLQILHVDWSLEIKYVIILSVQHVSADGPNKTSKSFGKWESEKLTKTENKTKKQNEECQFKHPNIES